MESTVTEGLLKIPIGVIVQWITLITAIVGGASAFAIKMYKVFDKYKKVKDENASLVSTVSEHEKKINEVDKKIDLIIQKLDAQDEKTMKSLRRELVRDGERFIVEGAMTIREWKSWMEMYDVYRKDFNQNSYVETLKNKIEQQTTIVGKLDEHGNDIE